MSDEGFPRTFFFFFLSSAYLLSLSLSIVYTCFSSAIRMSIYWPQKLNQEGAAQGPGAHDATLFFFFFEMMRRKNWAEVDRGRRTTCGRRPPLFALTSFTSFL